MQWLSNLPLTSLRVQFCSLVAVAILGVIFLVQRYRGTGSTAHRWRLPLVGAGVAGLLAGIAIWVAGDVVKVFGDQPIAKSIIAWVVAGGVVVGASLGALAFPGRRRRWWHVITAFLLIVAAVLSSALAANRIAGYYATPHQIFSQASDATLPGLPKLHLDSIQDVDLSQGWTPEPGTPDHGMLIQQDIPATASGFKARPALIYLPPAALSKHPPRLPLIIAFAGEPGAPNQILQAGQLQELAEEYQSQHGGIAPILVAPDQLGSENANPMCVDSKLGNNETYLVVDVMGWVRQHLPVAQDAAHTAILGFSQGGTCSVQLAFGHPEIASTIVPISAELEPTIGADTVATAFDGDEAKYQAVTPLAVLTAHGPYQDLRAEFFVGETDTQYSAWAQTLVAAAKQQGVDATLTYSPGTGHDWHTASYGVTQSFPLLISRLGLPS